MELWGLECAPLLWMIIINKAVAVTQWAGNVLDYLDNCIKSHSSWV